MKIKEIRERLKIVDDKLCRPKGENDVKSGMSEFYKLKTELEEKGFPKHGISRLAYSIRYGWSTVKELNEKSITVYGGYYNFCGSCIV